ncbi:MAG: hypothetical protein H0U23_07330 [Blastocatellia bacterium]|nr:hypothetical protein [Blastocatellia bacterium]
MELAKVSKAIAGGASTVAALGAAQATGFVNIIPADVVAPWWGYVLIYIAAAVVGFVGVYVAPANKL